MTDPQPLVNIKREITDTIDNAITRITESLKTEGFGVLTRIDLHAKIKEKLGHDVAPTVILGACNPTLAHEAYRANTDVASLLPCNVVVREVGEGRISIECALPSGLMRVLGDQALVTLAGQADGLISRALEKA